MGRSVHPLLTATAGAHSSWHASLIVTTGTGGGSHVSVIQQSYGGPAQPAPLAARAPVTSRRQTGVRKDIVNTWRPAGTLPRPLDREPRAFPVGRDAEARHQRRVLGGDDAHGDR